MCDDLILTQDSESDKNSARPRDPFADDPQLDEVTVLPDACWLGYLLAGLVAARDRSRAHMEFYEWQHQVLQHIQRAALTACHHYRLTPGVQ